MSKIKSVRRLYFQFGDHLREPHLDAFEIAEAAVAAGLIEIIGYGKDWHPTYYRETFPEKLPYWQYRELFTNAIEEYCRMTLRVKFVTKKEYEYGITSEERKATRYDDYED